MSLGRGTADDLCHVLAFLVEGLVGLVLGGGHDFGSYLGTHVLTY